MSDTMRMDGVAVKARPADRHLHRPGRPAPWVIPTFVLVWSLLLLLPLVVLFAYSFFDTHYFMMVYTPSLRTWSDLFASGRLQVAVRTFRIATSVTAINLAIGFPFALWLAKGGVSRSHQALVLALLTIPFFLDASSRIIVWRGILGERGLINTVLVGSHVLHVPLAHLLFNEAAVQFGMVLSNFPFMVLPIYMSISIVDDALMAAAADLGASPVRVLVDVVVPLSTPGIVAGVVLTFGSALAAWIEPAMLGGGFVNMLGASVESAYTAMRYPVVAALSTMAILLVGGFFSLIMLLTRRVVKTDSVFRGLEA